MKTIDAETMDEHTNEVVEKVTKPKFRKRVIGGVPELYFHESEKWYNGDKSIYDTAKDWETNTIFCLDGLTTKKKLEFIKEEIHVRIKITNQEVFLIGELLDKAKKICQEDRIRFKQWIRENFDFSYELANNFINVFKQCYGYRGIALRIPTTILYKLGSASFPEELREYLLTNGNLEYFTNGKFNKITQKYKEGGIEAIEEDIQEFSNSRLAYCQCKYTFDLVESSLRTLADLKTRIQRRGHTRIIFDYKDEIKHDQPIASEINMKLFEAIEKAHEIVDRALKESDKIIEGYNQRLIDKM
jgi:hypothetical protein